MQIVACKQPCESNRVKALALPDAELRPETWTH